MAARSNSTRRLVRVAALLLTLMVLLVWVLPTQIPEGWTPHEAQPPQPLELSERDRILVLSPHPDDDVLACAGIIQKAVARKIPLHVVFFTNGDANEWSFITYSHRVPVRARAVQHMGDLRHDEALAGESLLGISQDHLTFLGYPDHGTLAIFTSRWRDAPPLRSLLTRVNAVPYAYALHAGAPYKGESIIADISAVIERLRPTRIFVSHPADRNADHRALYLFTRVALWHLPDVAARLHPFLVHNPSWPRPPGPHEGMLLSPPPPLRDRVDWESEPLDEMEVRQKGLAIRAHRTQMSYSSRYLLTFVRANELFGDFPGVDLAGASAASSSPSLATTDGELRELFAEPAPLVGREWRFARLRDGRLELSLMYSRAIARDTRAVFHIFGDRADRSFAQMPKLSVNVSPFRLAVYDQATLLSHPDVLVKRAGRKSLLSVSLQALGNPQHVLVSAQSYLGAIALDDGTWSVIDVRP